MIVSDAGMMAAKIRNGAKIYGAAGKKISTDAGNAASSLAAEVCLTI